VDHILNRIHLTIQNHKKPLSNFISTQNYSDELQIITIKFQGFLEGKQIGDGKKSTPCNQTQKKSLIRQRAIILMRGLAGGMKGY